MPVTYTPTESYVRVATACPRVAVGNIEQNVQHIGDLYAEAVKRHVSLVVFPELSLTGYTLGDLVQQKQVLERSLQGLLQLAKRTAQSETAMVVGLPVAVGNALYDCAAVLSKGVIRGIVPKTSLPSYKEFYEKRWFQAWQGDNVTVDIGGQVVPFGTNLLFQVGRAQVGVEICEDVWVSDQPSQKLVAAGATIIANPSASPEQITKDEYRRQLISIQSARLMAGYLYAGCDASESTMDIVMSGQQLIFESGQLLAERTALSDEPRLLVTDIDIDHLLNDRRRDTNFPNNVSMPVVDCQVTPNQTDTLRSFATEPFVPKAGDMPDTLEKILAIQAQGLASRMQNTGVNNIVLGLSGGLDSTLALFVALRTAERLGKRPADILQTITMPGKASSKHTQSNAAALAAALGVPNQIIAIADQAQAQLAALGHDGTTQDTTYENVQARLRTSILFNRANQTNGLVLGTGDLSEIALGWCTYNGDHMSHYNVNASVPKTLVKHLVAHAVSKLTNTEAQQIVQAILETPISPELTSAREDDISQHTEDLIGPYLLHDLFLYHFVRWNDTPAKIAYIAEQAFKDSYKPAEIRDWLTVFIQRFMHSQWKRSAMPDGPKIGSVSLSPRGDWRMPSDM
ncbi:MAG TPA: NAD(+) synthase [Patescibacteria group bacterium]|nr:NAD(+) synthase [Patescibacteria group bacterium]